MREELREKRERKVKLDLKDKKGIWAPKVIEEYLVHLESKELKGLKALKVQKVHQERQDPLDQLVKKAKMDHLGLLVILVALVIREIKEPKEEMDHQVLKEREAKMVYKVRGVKQDLEDLEEELVGLEVLE